jgi:DNA-binding beta-propeller fold protein YncE
MVPGSARIAAAAPIFLGTFTEPHMCSPRGVALSPSGDVLVGTGCYSGTHIALFTGAGTLIETWELGGGWQTVVPNGIAVDGSGVVFVTDFEGNRIRKYVRGLLFSSFVTALQPVDIALNAANEVFVVMNGGNRV